jgi:hypothetical protein
MKKINYKDKVSFYSMIMVLLIVTMFSCSKELDAPASPPLETGTLSASESAVVIDNTDPFGEAVTFSWTARKNSHVVYELVLSAGENSDTVEVSTEVSKKFTNVELNTILLDELGLEIGEAADVNIVVHSKVVQIDNNNKTASSNVITISVTPDNKVEPPPAYTKLWIVGDATPNKWDIGNPNEMVNDPINAYQFKYNEVLTAGEFKIPVATGSWSADFYMPPVNHPDLSSTSVKLIAGGSPDNKWIISDAGAYKILLNISSSPFIKITPFTPYANIYIVGDATTAGWDAGNAIALTADPGDDNIFTWTGELGEGQFRFLLTLGDLNGESFVAPSTDASITATQLAFAPDGNPANNFKVKAGEGGTYTITVDQLKETISIVKQ